MYANLYHDKRRADKQQDFREHNDRPRNMQVSCCFQHDRYKMKEEKSKSNQRAGIRLFIFVLQVVTAKGCR